MSAVVPIKLDEMQNAAIVCSMLRKRLGGLNETDDFIYGQLGNRFANWVQYNKKTNTLSIDGDVKHDMTKRLQNFYEFEKVRATAEDLGLSYAETLDPHTGQVVACEVDGDSSQYQQLIMEVA